MKVTIRRNVTVGQLLAEVERRYGSEKELRAHLRRHPKDTMANLALHDLREYRGEDPAEVIRETRQIIIPDHALDELTVQRLMLLFRLKGLAGAVPSLRALARAVQRDVKNVSEDVDALRGLGLLEVESQGPGKPSRIALPGDSIDLHLVEAEG